MLKGKTAIFGSGPFTCHLAEMLVAEGSEVVVITHARESDLSSILQRNTSAREISLEVVDEAECRRCRQTGAGYTLQILSRGKQQIRNVNRIVLADGYEKQPVFHLYGLQPGSSVISISEFSQNPDGLVDGLPEGAHIVFVSGLGVEVRPENHRRIMESALSVQMRKRFKTIVFTGNLKVAARGLDALYRECRMAGVLFVKTTEPLPAFCRNGQGISIAWVDEVTREPFRVRPELVIVDEIIKPAKRLVSLARVLEIDSDISGFAQADNIHRLVVKTNRRGIYAAGPSRDFVSPEALDGEAASVALAVLEDGKDNLQEQTLSAPAEINPRKCVRCLTCYRLCPYRAVSVNSRLTIDPLLCQRCGICAAECPAMAIELPGFSKENLLQGECGDIVAKDQRSDHRRIQVFCCARSAGRAWRLATMAGKRIPVGVAVAEVPCAGAVSIDFLLSAFLAGADGVLVLACHEGNCHSQQGSLFARNRVDSLADILESAGIGADRLAAFTLASNMGVEFARIVSGFADRISALKPLNLNSG